MSFRPGCGHSQRNQTPMRNGLWFRCSKKMRPEAFSERKTTLVNRDDDSREYRPVRGLGVLARQRFSKPWVEVDFGLPAGHVA